MSGSENGTLLTILRIYTMIFSLAYSLGPTYIDLLFFSSVPWFNDFAEVCMYVKWITWHFLFLYKKEQSSEETDGADLKPRPIWSTNLFKGRS